MGPNRTHIGAITFATEEKIYFTLGQITELESIEKALGNIKQKRGGKLIRYADTVYTTLGQADGQLN